MQSGKSQFGRWVVLSLSLACVALGFLGRTLRAAQPDEGKVVFLVARREILDPFFERSVVLMLPTAKLPLVVGLIINKPARVPLGKLFPGNAAFKNRTHTAYFGGPVDVHVPSLVFQSSKVPARALRLYQDVYLTFDSRSIVAQLKKENPSSKLRLFLGRAQWAPEQLKNEIGHGAWYSERGRGDLIFSSTPRRLWQTLHDRVSPGNYIRYRLPAGPPSGFFLAVLPFLPPRR